MPLATRMVNAAMDKGTNRVNMIRLRGRTENPHMG